MMLPLLPPEKAYLSLPENEAVPYEAAQAVILPFGLEASVSYGGGTANGPGAMLSASAELELFDEELWCEPFRDIGIVTTQEPDIPADIPAALSLLEQQVEQVVSDRKFPFVFGGEHSITAGAIRPFLQRYDDLVILHFDAHADLRDGYQGEPYSHAAALRRCLDDTRVTLVSCGIRNISAEEIPFLQANQERIHIHWAKDKARWNLEEIMEPLRGKPIYLTFDLDGFDASLMPATGTPEPGGLFWDDAIAIIRQAARVGQIVGADINELAPLPGFHACDFLAAKLAYKILAYRFLPDRLAQTS